MRARSSSICGFPRALRDRHSSERGAMRCALLGFAACSMPARCERTRDLHSSCLAAFPQALPSHKALQHVVQRRVGQWHNSAPLHGLPDAVGPSLRRILKKDGSCLLCGCRGAG